jgi:sodium transport system ATP-binding protein
MTGPPAIAAEALTRRYDDLVAVDAVSFEVRTGEVFALLGPNGAGKTTLLRMLSGVLAPTTGRALVHGVDAALRPEEAKALLGFISGDTALYGRLSVREVLGYFAELHGLGRRERDRRVEAASETFGLAAFLEARVELLSSGQRQRANLARAFLTDPPVLILDEPTSALDVISGRFVHEAVERARDRGQAVLLSTHDMSEAERLADRVGLLVGGRLAATGTRAALLEGSGAPSLADLLVHLHGATDAGR